MFEKFVMISLSWKIASNVFLGLGDSFFVSDFFPLLCPTTGCRICQNYLKYIAYGKMFTFLCLLSCFYVIWALFCHQLSPLVLMGIFYKEVFYKHFLMPWGVLFPCAENWPVVLCCWHGSFCQELACKPSSHFGINFD